MNNNNLYNTNNFIGTIHQDYFKTASNALASNIKATSNILENHSSNFTLYTSNILENHSSNFTTITSNKITTYYNNLINNYEDVGFYNATNTHIFNNNILGEIRFITKGAPSYFGDNLNYVTKIQENGQIAVYYTYNPLYPTVIGPKWYVLTEVIKDIYSFQATTGALLGTLQIEINSLNGSVIGLEAVINSTTLNLAETNAEVKMIEESLGYLNINTLNTLTYAEIEETIQLARTNGWFQIFNNASIAGFSYLSVIGIGASVIGSILYTNYITQQTNILSNMKNSNITAQQQQQFINEMENINVSNVSNYNVNSCNLNINQGFINSNITTPQTIPSIVSNGITLYGNIVTTGQITGITTLSASTGLFGTISITNNTNSGLPALGTYGGTGDKLIFKTGSTLNYPYSIGTNTNSLWYSGPTGMSHNFYSGGNNLLTIDSSGNLNATGTIDSPNIKQGGTNVITLSQSNILYNSPNVNKKFAFYCSTTNLIYPDGVNPYYAYHLYIPEYISTGYIQIGSGSGDPYRTFKIRCFYGSCYFQKLTNGIPDIVDYTIYMSNKANAGGSGTIAGINIQAMGEPKNPLLNNVMRNNLFMLRNVTNHFDYISIVSKEIADVRVFIEDLLA